MDSCVSLKQVIDTREANQMIITHITIQGVEDDLTIRRTDTGALVSTHDVDVAFDRTLDADERYSIAYHAAKVVCGTTRRGEPNATNSMIHDILNEIQRVAGC